MSCLGALLIVRVYFINDGYFQATFITHVGVFKSLQTRSWYSKSTSPLRGMQKLVEIPESVKQFFIITVFTIGLTGTFFLLLRRE